MSIKEKNTSSNVKGAHYVPKFILKNFAFNTKKQIYAENIDNGEKYTTNINDACTRHRFYNYKTQNASLENFFGQIEAFVSARIDKIIEPGINIQLDMDDMYALIIYRASQSIRGPIFIEKHFELKKFIEEATQAFKIKSEISSRNQMVGLTEAEWHKIESTIKEYTPTHSERDEALDFMCSVLYEPIVNPSRYVNDLQFQLFYSPDNSFIINDRGFSVNTDIGEFWLPLSPNFILQTYPKRLTPNYQSFTWGQINSKKIEAINHSLKQCAEKCIYSSQQL